MPVSNRSWSQRLLAQPVHLALALVFSGWTFFWALQGIQGILAHTSLGRGEVADGLAFHQVWELVFVASVYLVRWIPGVFGLVILLMAGPTLRRVVRVRRPRREALSQS